MASLSVGEQGILSRIDSKENDSDPILQFIVFFSQCPESQAARLQPLRGHCCIFIAPCIGGRVGSSRQCVVSHDLDLQKDGTVQRDFIVSCILELSNCPVALTAYHQIAAFLILRCSLTPINTSQMAGLIDHCLYSDDTSTLSALLSHALGPGADELNQTNPEGLMGATVIPSDVQHEWCVAVTACEASASNRLDLVLVTLVQDYALVTLVIRQLRASSAFAKVDRFVVVGPRGEILYPTDHSFEGSVGFDVEACWLSVSRTLNQWRLQDAQSGEMMQSMRRRAIIELGDLTSEGPTSGGSAGFSADRFTSRNPTFFNVSRHFFVFEPRMGAPSSAFLQASRRFFSVSKHAGRFVNLGACEGEFLPRIMRSLDEVISAECGTILSRIHLALVSKNRGTSGARSAELSACVSSTPLPRIGGAVYSLGSIDGTANVRAAIGRLTAAFGLESFQMFCWAYSHSQESYVSFFVPLGVGSHSGSFQRLMLPRDSQPHVLHWSRNSGLLLDHLASWKPNAGVSWSSAIDALRCFIDELEMPAVYAKQLSEATSIYEFLSLISRFISAAPTRSNLDQKSVELNCNIASLTHTKPALTRLSSAISPTGLGASATIAPGIGNGSGRLAEHDDSDDEADELHLNAVTAIDARAAPTVFVDERWLSLGKSLAAASSLESSLTKVQPSGVLTQRSFSIQISKFSHGVLYVSLPACDALAHIPRSPNVRVTRKLFLCDTTDGDVIVSQTETIHDGPTWHGGEGVFSGAATLASEHAFYNLERGRSYCVIHVAAMAPEGEWLQLRDFLVADGVEFTTPISYVQDVLVEDVLPRSMRMSWEGNCNGYMISYEKVASEAYEGESAPVVVCTSTQEVHLGNLVPASIYIIRISPNAASHREAVDVEEVVVATPPEVDRSMLSYTAFSEPSDPFCVTVRVSIDFVSPRHGGLATPSFAEPIVFRGRSFDLICTPRVFVNHSETETISLRAGSPVLVSVGFHLSVLRRSTNFRVFNKDSAENFSTKLGPFHVVTGLKVKDPSDTSCRILWHTSNAFNVTRLHLVRVGRPVSDDDRSSTQGNERHDELSDETIQVINVPAGETEYCFSELTPDTKYRVSVSCDGIVAEQFETFSTMPPPPKISEVVVQHNSSLRSLFFTLPASEQLQGRSLKVTVLPNKEVFRSSPSKTESVIADVGAASSHGEPIAVELVQFVDSADGCGILESEPTLLFVISNLKLVMSAAQIEVRFTCGMRSPSISVGLGSQFVVAEENCRAVFDASKLAYLRGKGERTDSIAGRPQLPSAEGLIGAPSPFRGVVQPLIFNGVNLVEEQATIFCVLPPRMPPSQLFSVKIFETHAIVDLDFDMANGFLSGVCPESLWLEGLLQVSLAFVSPCTEQVTVPLPLQGPAVHAESLDAERIPSRRVHSVIVPLSQGRSLTSTVSCFFVVEFFNDEQHVFLNEGSLSSPPVVLATPRVFSISSMIISAVSPHTAIVEWSSQNDLYDVTVLHEGLPSFTTKTTQSRVALEGLTAGAVYHVVVTGNMSGAHEGHLTFVTPVDTKHLRLSDFCTELRVADDGILHMQLPPTLHDSCTTHPNRKGSATRLTRLSVRLSRHSDKSGFIALPNSPMREWLSDEVPQVLAISVFNPSHLKDLADPSDPASDYFLPHLLVCASASISEEGGEFASASSEPQRVDILGCPRVEFSENYEFATILWMGSAPNYTITIQPLVAESQAHTTSRLTKASSSLAIRCADYSGQVLSVSVRSLEHLSNTLAFSVVIPPARRPLRIVQHTLSTLVVEIPPPQCLRLVPFPQAGDSEESVLRGVTIETTVEFGGVHYAYTGDGKEPMLCSITMPRPLKSDAGDVYVASCVSESTCQSSPQLPKLTIKARVEVSGISYCLNSQSETVNTQLIPLLKELAGARVSAISQAGADVTWSSTDDEFYCNIKTFKAASLSDSEGCVERNVVVSTPCLRLQSLPAGSYHEVVIRGRRTGDTQLQTAFFTSPAFADKSVSFRRHHNGTKFTVLLDGRVHAAGASQRFGERDVTVTVELLICDAHGDIREMHPLGRDALTLDFTAEVSLIYVRKLLRGVKRRPVPFSAGHAFADSAAPVTSGGNTSVPEDIQVESRLLVCKARRYVQFSDILLKSAGSDFAILGWSPLRSASGTIIPLSYSATIEPVETLSHIGVDKAAKQVLSTNDSELNVTSLIESTLYRAHISVKGNFGLQTEAHPAIIVHDDAPEIPSVCRYFVTRSRKPLGVPHKRYVGGARFFLDIAIPAHRKPYMRLCHAVRVLPDNVLYVQNQPWSNAGVPEPTLSAVSSTRPSFLIIPTTTTIESNRFCIDVALNEPAAERTHRFEYYRVIEVSKDFPEFGNVLNGSQYSEADVQPIQLVRALSKPQCIGVSSSRAELKWSMVNTLIAQDSLQFDVIVDNLLVSARQEVQRVAGESVALDGLSSATAYRVTVAASVRDSPCEPVSVIVLTSPRRPKAPKLSSAQLSVVFDLPQSALWPSADGHNVTVSTTALVICVKEVDTGMCATAVEFMEKTQTRNIFRSTPNAAQRIDLRLRSSKLYKFVFFTSIHHPEAINGVVHSKPTVVDFRTDCVPPHNLHMVSRTKASVTIGWSTADFGTKTTRFEAQVKAMGPLAHPETLESLRGAAGLGDALGGSPAIGELLRAINTPAHQHKLSFGVDGAIENQIISSTSGSPLLHCTFPKLSPLILYAFRVRQMVGEAASEWSNMLLSSPLAPPTPVTHLRVAHITGTSISLTWIPSHSHYEGETESYLVQIKDILPTFGNSVVNAMHTAKGGIVSGASSSKQVSSAREEVTFGTSVDITNLEPGHQYRIIVVPVNHYGERCEDKNATLLVRTESISTWR